MNIDTFKKKCREEQKIVEEEELQLETRMSQFKELISEQVKFGKRFRPKIAFILNQLFLGYVCPICSKPLDEEVIIKKTLGVDGASIYRCEDCEYEYAMFK